MRQDYITITLGLPESRVLTVIEGPTLIEIWIEKATTHEACPACHGFSDQGHTWRWDDVWDQPIWDKAVLLWVHKRRFECVNPGCWRKRCHRPFLETYRSIDKGQYRTHRLDRYIYHLTKRMANTDVVRELSACHTPISDNTVGRIYQRLGDDEWAGYAPGRRVAIGVDEYSIQKGHKYATIITDPVRHQVIETFPGRDKETVQAHLVALFPPKLLLSHFPAWRMHSQQPFGRLRTARLRNRPFGPGLRTRPARIGLQSPKGDPSAGPSTGSGGASGRRFAMVGAVFGF